MKSFQTVAYVATSSTTLWLDRHGALEARLDVASAASIRAHVVAIVAVLAVAQYAIATDTRLAERDLASQKVMVKLVDKPHEY